MACGTGAAAGNHSAPPNDRVDVVSGIDGLRWSRIGRRARGALAVALALLIVASAAMAVPSETRSRLLGLDAGRSTAVETRAAGVSKGWFALRSGVRRRPPRPVATTATSAVVSPTTGDPTAPTVPGPPTTAATGTTPAADPSSPAATAPTASTVAAPSTPAAPNPSAPAPTAPTATTTAPPAASGGGGGSCTRAGGSGVTVTDVALPTPVVGAGRGDTDPLPMAIAATPDGGSWLAWLGTDAQVHLARLDCNDRMVGTSFAVAGIDLQDVAADATGVVVLVTRPGDCHTGPLCGGTASPCRTMHLVRLDNAGRQVWQQQVTNLTDTRGGYDDGARFVWWYQHHGRIATDGTNWAAYFGVAITVKNGSCVDIHEGDRMQVVGPSGQLLSGHDSFEVGCSHAWTSRIVWDSRTGHFQMACATDNNCRIAQPNPYRTIAASTCDGTLFGGDLVNATTSGYWTAWSQGGQARLSHFTTGAADTTKDTGAQTQHPHLVRYGAGRMLMAWGSGSAMTAQVYDAGSGTAVGSTFTIGVKDHPYQAFKPYPDGSVAFPATGSSSSTASIARVVP